MTCLAESCFAERKGTLFTSSAKKLVIIKPMFNGCRSQQQPRLFGWQSSGTNRRLLISLICSLTQRSYSRDTSPPLNGHTFGRQRFHNILLCCAEDPSYTNITLSQTPNLCSTSQILLVHLVKHVSGPPLGRAGCCHISSFFSLHG